MGRSRRKVVPAGIAGRRGSSATHGFSGANGIPVNPIDAPPAVVRRISTEGRDIRERPPLRPSRGERFSPFAGSVQTANFAQPDACKTRGAPGGNHYRISKRPRFSAKTPVRHLPAFSTSGVVGGPQARGALQCLERRTTNWSTF